MKILKQLTLDSEKVTFKLVATYHHVDDDSFDDRTGYSQTTIYEAFSYDDVRNLGELIARQAKVTFTNLFEGKSSVPCELGLEPLSESLALMRNEL